MFPNYLISIKKKKLSKLDVEKPLVNYIQSEKALEAIEAAKEFNSLRNKLTNCTENESGTNILQLYYRYDCFFFVFLIKLIVQF